MRIVRTEWTEMELRQLLAKKVKKAGTQMKLAAELGVNQMEISFILTGQRGISEAFALKVFGLEKIVIFREKEVE